MTINPEDLFAVPHLGGDEDHDHDDGIPMDAEEQEGED